MRYVHPFTSFACLMLASMANAEQWQIGEWSVVAGVTWGKLRAEDRTGFLGMTHRDLAGQQLILRMPEYANLYKGLLPMPARWRKLSESEVEMEWAAPEAVQQKHQVAREARFTFGPDFIDVRATVRNPTERIWPHDRYDLYDVMTRNAPLFRDDSGERTLVYRGRQFVSVKTFWPEGFNRDRTGSLSLAADIKNPGPRQITDRIMAKTSRDGKWVLGIASDVARGISFNLQTGTGCIHQNPFWGRLKAGEEKAIHCRVYLIRGTLADLWQRYARDFADTALHAEGNPPALASPSASSGEKPEAGRVLSPWAPATDLGTVAALASKRPASCSGDALACWVADQLSRDGDKVTPSAVQAGRSAFSTRSGFAVREDRTGLWIANGKVGLRFRLGPSRRELVSFYDLTHCIEMIGGTSANGSPIRIQILKYRPDGTTGVLNFGPQWRRDSPDPSMVVEVDGRAAAAASHELSVSDSQLVLQLKWDGIRVPDTPGALHAIVTVRLHSQDGLTYWRAKVAGHLPQAGIAQVRCPVVSRLGYPNEVDVCYAWGSQRGVMRRATDQPTRGTYPSSQWSLQHFSISFGPRSVLYAACHDPDSHVKSFYVKPGHESYLSAYAPNTGVLGNSTYEQPYEVAIGPMSGDWFDAAQRYREWAAANGPWAAARLRDRSDVAHRMLKVAYWVRCNWMHDDDRGDEGWAFDQAMLRLPVRETVEWYRRVLGVPDDRLGGIHYGWQREVWDTRLPFWTPQGPHIARELRRQTGLGMSTYIYTNPCWYDPRSEGYGDGVERAITRNIDGSMYFEKYNAKMYEINRAAPLLRDVQARLAELAKKLGSNGIYYDQFSGLLRGGDYDREKGLPSLGLGGNWLPRARQGAMQSVRRRMGSDFGFTSEFYCETNQHLFDVQSVTIHCEPWEVPLIPAIYSGYVVQHGAGVDHRTRPTSAVVSLGRNFLWGTALGWTQFATELHRHYTRQLLKQLVQLRVQLDDFVVYGRMVRPPPFTAAPPSIALDDWYVHGKQRAVKSCDAYEASLWRAGDGRLSLLVVNFDKRLHTISVRLEGPLGNTGPASLLKPDGGATVRVREGVLALRMPGRCGAAVLLSTRE